MNKLTLKTSYFYINYYTIILLLLTIIILGSCSKDNEETTEPEKYPPQLTVILPDTNEFIVGPGENFQLSLSGTANASGNANLTSFRIFTNFNNQGFVLAKDSTFSSSVFVLDNYVCTVNDAEGIEEWLIILKDSNGEADSSTFITHIVNLNPIVSFLDGEYEPGKERVDSDVSLLVGTEFVFGITANKASEQDLKRVLIERNFENISTITIIDSVLNTSEISMDFQVFAYPTQGSEVFEVTIWDKADRSTMISFTVTTTPAASNITTYVDKILGAQNNNAGIAFASTTGTIYNLADAKENAEKIDWMYFYGISNMATIASPNDESAALVYNHVMNGLQTWSVLNNTLFKETTLSSADFNAITSSVQLVAAAQCLRVLINL